MALITGWTISDIIDAVGVVATLLGIIFAVYSTNRTIRSSFTQIQKTNMIEKTSELPLKIFEFTRVATAAFACGANIASDSISEEDRSCFQKQFQEYDKTQSKLLDEIIPMLLAYGSENTIEIFNEFFMPLREMVNNPEDVKMIEDVMSIYSKLPLICSLIKYDVTGEITNPSIIFKTQMSSFSGYQKDFKMETNNLIDKRKLPEGFKWK